MATKEIAVIAFALALSAGSAVAGGKPAPAYPLECGTLDDFVTECNSFYFEGADRGLVPLCSAIYWAESLDTRDRDTMVSKVIDTAVKITQQKYTEAQTKMGQIEDKLDSLTPENGKAKISVNDDLSIRAEYYPAYSCVTQLE